MGGARTQRRSRSQARDRGWENDAASGAPLTRPGPDSGVEILRASRLQCVSSSGVTPLAREEACKTFQRGEVLMGRPVSCPEVQLHTRPWTRAALLRNRGNVPTPHRRKPIHSAQKARPPVKPGQTTHK